MSEGASRRGMSVKPSDEPGSEGGWYGDDLENMELFGKKKNSSARFEDEQKQHSHHPPHPVAMETASTGNVNSAKQCSFTKLHAFNPVPLLRGAFLNS